MKTNIERYDDIVDAILDYLRIPVAAKQIFAPLRLQKMADATNEEWAQRYNQIRASRAESTSQFTGGLRRGLRELCPKKLVNDQNSIARELSTRKDYQLQSLVFGVGN